MLPAAFAALSRAARCRTSSAQQLQQLRNLNIHEYQVRTAKLKQGLCALRVPQSGRSQLSERSLRKLQEPY